MANTNIIELYSSIKNEQLKIQAVLSELVNNDKKLTVELSDKVSQVDLLDKTYDFLQNVSEYARNSIKDHFEQFVTFVLQYVFGDEIEFKLEWNNTAKGNSIEFKVKTPYELKGVDLLVDPVDGDGGGRQDVVAFALRLAFLALLNNRETVFIDESFSQISAEYLSSISSLLHDLNEKFGYQFIFITHQRESAFTENADFLFLLSKKDGISKVEQII